MKLSEDVINDIRDRVLCGYENREQLFESIIDLYWEELGMTAVPIPTQPNAVKIVSNDPTNDAISERVRTAIDEAFARKAEEMKSWPAVTDCERLRNAFDVLDQQGIVALENAGLTQTSVARHWPRSLRKLPSIVIPFDPARFHRIPSVVAGSRQPDGSETPIRHRLHARPRSLRPFHGALRTAH